MNGTLGARSPRNSLIGIETELFTPVFNIEYKTEMVKDLINDTSGDFKRIVVSMCAACRDEDGPELDGDEAMNYAQVRHPNISQFS